ncbi:ornithine cyclodeaminase [Mesorhizobium sp. B2-7-1]|uniref:ornithine cyclodeaminase family protein n=1 Tax=Mesorhizobium sp. B2-7-1 TaxID=2589909 RepID=UPI00112C6660|nr:ornithine cyclodeaminase [Mesorhizobium sp. B2-7-1]TPJ71233.1 ornithine cyclodeaminase [Mesorhizobium sp. B2-7-1]
MHLIDGPTVHELLGYRSLVDALRLAHQAPMPEVQEVVLGEPGGDNARNLIVLPAWQRGALLGAKLVTVFPENPSRAEPVPANQGIYAAFDAETGTPVMVADGTALTLRKTAADSALGADLLARPDARSLLMIGAGALAPHVISAMLAVRPSINAIRIWNRTPERAKEIAAAMARDGFPIEVAERLDDALCEADIVSSATMAEVPLIHGDVLRPGCHVNLIGGWNPQMREVDDRTIERARLFTDSRSQCGSCGDFLQPVESGVMTWDDIEADLFELCGSSNLRPISPQDITLFKNCGGGHLDLFVAQELIRKIRHRTKANA